ncbi:hypothetical protein L1987_21166 [Smallanthus sonchifolius]|uniref:Uncharacterized protein n=1 Tax=Smallanthus sonchifolius TaxID=185202 RepID=A0ACB9IUC7_9ASTR|nr:hypothetical protein L1987_21166 [Smallanthus sonchifolius]
MDKQKPCNTTLRLGTDVEVRREKLLKQSKRGFWLDLSLPIHPKIEGSVHDDHDQTQDEEPDDQDSFCSKFTDHHEKEEERRTRRSDCSKNDVYVYNSGGSRKKLKLSTEQITLLEDSFKIHSTLNTGQKQELAKKLHLLPQQIEVWFQNRRARTKLKQIEQECVFLKKRCATLNDENNRLKKELREAQRCSLKFDHHFQPQPSQPPLPFYIRYQTSLERHPFM